MSMADAAVHLGTQQSQNRNVPDTMLIPNIQFQHAQEYCYNSVHQVWLFMGMRIRGQRTVYHAALCWANKKPHTTAFLIALNFIDHD